MVGWFLFSFPLLVCELTVQVVGWPIHVESLVKIVQRGRTKVCGIC